MNEWLGHVCIAKEATSASKGPQATAATPTLQVMNTRVKQNKKNDGGRGNQNDGANTNKTEGKTTSGGAASQPDAPIKKAAGTAYFAMGTCMSRTSATR